MKKKIFIKYFLAFLIPFLILILFCISRKIGIFGDYSLLVSDFHSQYILLLKNLREGGSMVYSLFKGLGGGMIGTFAYYLSSPLNILIYLFPKDQIVLASIFLIVFRISLSGLTMFTYLTNHFKEKKYEYLIFSTCYALMAYVVNYHFHIMWLDGIMLLPLIMMGIDRLFEKKKSELYIITLFLAVFSNYYIGYMICIMSVLYFLGNLFLKYSWKENKKEIKKIIIKFIISSLLAGLMTMVLQIPNFLELQNGYKSNIGELDYSGFNFSFLNLWSRTYISSHNAGIILAKDVISIYCGLIILPLLYFYFTNKKIKIREKIVYGSILLILLSGYFINAIGMIYHGFNFANCFNYRFSFLICFIMIMIACKSFNHIKEIKISQYLIFYIFYIIMSLVTYLNDYYYLNIKSIYISCTIMGIYMVLLYLYKRYNKNKDIKILLFAIVFAELLFNLFSSLEKFEYIKQDEFNYYANTMGTRIEQLQNENEAYRIETTPLSTYNGSFFMHYHSISSFLSTTDIRHLQFLKNAGFQSTAMSVWDNDNNTALIDSILGIKYRITSKDKKIYNAVDSINYPIYSGLLFHPTVLTEATIYENPYALSLGYTIATDYDEKNELSDPFDFQNYILNNMLGNDIKYFKPYKRSKLSEGAYEFTIDNDEDIYIYYMFTAQSGECNVLINGKPINDKSEIFLYKGNMNGETIRVSLDGKVISYGEAVAYYFDSESFINDIKKLQNNNVQFETIEDGYIKGKVTITEDYNRLFLSIPYEEGWKLYVDGKEKDIDIIYDAFIAATLEEGEHEIELKYSVPGLKVGIAVSVISLTLTVIYLYFEKKSSKKLK